MAVARWRLFRLWGIESTTISEEIRKQESDPRSSSLPPATRAAVAMRSLSDKSDFVNKNGALSSNCRKIVKKMKITI